MRLIDGAASLRQSARVWAKIRLASACGLEEEPVAPFRLVDPSLDQAGGGHISVLVTNSVCLTQTRRQLLIVFTQFSEHIHGRDEICVVVQDSLQAGDVTNRPKRRAAYLANAFCNCVSRGEDLLTLFVKKQVIVAKMRTRHVPMKVLRFHIERKHIGEQDCERAG